MTGSRVPVATYRLQVHAGFNLHAARAIVPYLSELGISDVYLSPIFRAREGSTHGYDVIDPTVVNPEIGGPDALEALIATLGQHNMGAVLDIVPNHMAATPGNPWWYDVLEHGPHSRFARYFDIQWDGTPGYETGGRVLLPVLGEPLAEMIARGEIRVDHADGSFAIRVYDLRLPTSARSYRLVLDVALAIATDPDAESAIERLRDQAQAIPNGDAGAAGEFLANVRQAVATQPAIAETFDRAAQWLSAPGHSAQLERVLRAQWYILAWWRLAADHVNYRRFFDINDLVGVQAEQPGVFDDTHRLVLALASRPEVTGLRVDHIDGLRMPGAYLQQLRTATTNRAGEDAWIIVEKIVGADETLPDRWPVDGTSGYDFLNLVNGLFIDEAGVRAIDRWYGDQTGKAEPFPEMVKGSKGRALRSLFPGVLGSLASDLARIARADRQGEDVAYAALVEALAAVSVALPVYRTYIESEEVADRDAAVLDQAFATAGEGADPRALAFLRRVLTLDGLSGEQRERALDLVRRWQQLTGPLMAKGLEDTALYRDARLVAVNTVGRDPAHNWPVVSPAEFHATMAHQQAHWPHTMLGTSTHDTKRSEDVRCRMDVLSEQPGSWMDAVTRWREMNAPFRREDGEHMTPLLEEELYFYQTVAGVWPIQVDIDHTFVDRIKAYMLKAAREARIATSWTDPNEAHELALEQFIEAALDPARSSEFLDDMAGFARRLAWFGALNSLSEQTIKATAPGVPDYYQGTEIWDLSLVDPDNRRPVDYDQRRAMLEGLEGAHFGDLLGDWADGRVKLFCITRLLHLRHEERRLFDDGEYVPLEVRGTAAAHVVSFARRNGDRWLVTIAPRLFTQLALPEQPPCGEPVWTDAAVLLPADAPARWRDALTGAARDATSTQDGPMLALAKVLHEGPTAVLMATGA